MRTFLLVLALAGIAPFAAAIPVPLPPSGSTGYSGIATPGSHDRSQDWYPYPLTPPGCAGGSPPGPFALTVKLTVLAGLSSDVVAITGYGPSGSPVATASPGASASVNITFDCDWYLGNGASLFLVTGRSVMGAAPYRVDVTLPSA